ncbi:MAG TPA: alcohol dehydrogenase catalytic domain-containing protein [Candidatus Limnocylindrales bacterium]|jgi:threonine dehydrogenase-like Zn-dependent dehydrogenase
MRAFVIAGPGRSAVVDVDRPRAEPGQVIVDVARVGLCGTDAEFFSGEMAYLAQGHASYPVRIGHEWSGTVTGLGPDVDPAWLGRRVTGDTMIGCGLCPRCRSGRQHVCAERREIGIRGGFPGALAEQLALPASGLHALPDSVDDVAGALVEPGGNALRAVQAANLVPGDRLLVLGCGTIGLLAALFARARGAEVHLAGRSARSLDFAVSLGFADARPIDALPELAWDAVIDASTDPRLPALALELVEPGRRIVFIGLAGTPSLIDTRTQVLKDVTAVGILSGSAGLAGAIDLYARGAVDPRPLVATTVSLEQAGAILAGHRPASAGPGPKILVDPHL